MTLSAARRAGVDAFLASAERFVRSEGGKAPLFVRRLREEGLSAFGKLGFPAPDDEEWRTMNVGAVANGVFVPSPAVVPARERTEERDHALALDGRLGPIAFSDRKKKQIVFVNGRFSAEWSSTNGLPRGAVFETFSSSLEKRPDLLERHVGRQARSGEHPFVALNTAHLRDGALLYVPKGVAIEGPLFLYWVTTGSSQPPLMVSPRTLVVLEEAAQATLIEAFVGAGGTTFVNAVTEASLASGAVFEHSKLQREGPETLHVGNLRIEHGGDSQSRSHLFSFGGKLVRNELSVLLAGEGASTALNGLYCVSGSQHVDNHTLIDHARPRGSSQEFYKGILDGSARGAFEGRIVVRPSARLTDAHQKNRNLILSDTALVDSKPQLEIYNNDVKCTHGAATGRLDETMVFYLRSRGLDEAAARSLLTFAFGSEIVEKVAPNELYAYLEASLLSWLSHAGAALEAA
jgi:Fe-S cluster assembly protein SufD